MFEQLIKQGMSEGWGAFDNADLMAAQEKELQAEREEMRRQSQIVRDALANPAGVKFMHWLLTKTLHRPPGSAELSAVGAEAYAIAKARREGQNQIVFMIQAALDADDATEGEAAGELAAPAPVKKSRKGKR